MSRKQIDASLPRVLADDRHFTLDELHRAFVNGFGEVDRWRAIAHFGRARCEVCWGLLKELASLETLRVEGALDRDFDPVLLALQRLVAAYRNPATLDPLRPVYRFWLGHSRLEEFGFFRLILEGSRQHALEQPATGLAVARATLDLLELLPYQDLGHPWIDLKALAQAYLGDEHRAAGDPKSAMQRLAIAERELSRGTGDPELRATWLELRAELALAGGQATLALGLLDDALMLLREVEIEGRQAETRILQGLVRLRSGDDRGAAEAFKHALAAMPRGKSLRLRLRALQHLALAEVRNRRFTDARKHLAEAQALDADQPAPLLLQAQRLWIEGILHLETRNYSEAEGPLRESLQRFRLLERTLDAAQVLASLARLYAVTARVQEFAGLEQEFRPLLKASETQKWVLALRQRVVRWAQKAGISLPSEAEVLAELDADRERWIH